AQDILRSDMRDRGQFFRKVSRDRTADECLGSGQQSTVTGEPGRRARPQSIRSETRNFAESVETAAMRVAGQVVELFEFPENSEVDVRAEGKFQVGKRSDSVAEQQFSQGIGRESERSHNVIVATEATFQSKL